MINLENIRDFGLLNAQTLITLARIPLMCRPVHLPSISSGKELLILGNGPSLKPFLEKHPDFWRIKDLLVVNHFAETDFFTQVKPSLYVVSAPEYWLKDVEPDFVEKRQRIFNALTEKTNWPLHFFIPVHAKRNLWWKKLLDTNPNIHIHFYNTMPVEGFWSFRTLLMNMQCGMPRPHNVIVPALMNAIWSGWKKIYLIGTEHNWLKDVSIDNENRVYLTLRYFYNDQKARPTVIKHLGKGQRKLHEILEKFYWSFKAYHDIQKWAQKKGVKIYNITPGSWIDAFERKEI